MIKGLGILVSHNNSMIGNCVVLEVYLGGFRKREDSKKTRIGLVGC